MKSMEYLKYEENDLVKYFVAYNKYAGNSFIANTNYTRKEVINLKITPGLSNTSLSVINSYYNQLASLSYLYFKFNSKINYRIGLELEYIFPFNKNKWGFVIEPTYQNFNASTQNSNKVATIKFNSLEFPIGLRHYFHLNENYKIFLNGYFISNLSLKFNSSINFNFQSPFKITTGNSFAIGGGAYFKKISAEVRYYTKRELLFEYGYWTTDYHRFALLLGYRFL